MTAFSVRGFPASGQIGLLAFLLAFTIGMAAARYDTRKQMVLQEANAIGTAYLRANFLPEPQRGDVRNALRAYSALRVKGVTELIKPASMAQSSVLTERYRRQRASVGGHLTML